MDRTCSTHGSDENTYITSFGGIEGKKSLGRPVYRWGNDIHTSMKKK
jgi:hypothetical protein